jgi:hypothetical protein
MDTRVELKFDFSVGSAKEVKTACYWIMTIGRMVGGE